MNILKTILNAIFTSSPEVGQEESKHIKLMRSNISDEELFENDETIINPASGAPMIGGLDLMGNSFGSNSSSDDYYHRMQNDYNNSYSNNHHQDTYNYNNDDYWRNQ